jgi:DNA modification methylase
MQLGKNHELVNQQTMKLNHNSWYTPAMSTAVSQVVKADWIDFVNSLDDQSVDLMYVDPPFNTKKVQSALNGSYQDSWPSTLDWVDWFTQRIALTIPKIKQTGSILIHTDWRTTHHVRLVLDNLLGEDRFVNHLVWRYGLGGSSPRRFARKHDDILFYCIKPDEYYFEPPMVPATSNRMKGQLKKATDVLDIPSINNMASERAGYPTQKPLELLKLLIGACSPLDGIVLDPCCGSGTTLLAANTLGRIGIGCDRNDEAIKITRSRIQKTI